MTQLIISSKQNIIPLTIYSIRKNKNDDVYIGSVRIYVLNVNIHCMDVKSQCEN